MHRRSYLNVMCFHDRSVQVVSYSRAGTRLRLCSTVESHLSELQLYVDPQNNDIHRLHLMASVLLCIQIVSFYLSSNLNTPCSQRVWIGDFLL